MDARQQRGLAMAADVRIKKAVGAAFWWVPSASGHAKYAVTESQCSCPDHETRGVKCKHMWALEYARHQVTRPDGQKVVTETVRISYAQNWPVYNASQCSEKERVQYLLRALCDGIVSPPQGRGRPRIPLCDAVYGATMKVFTTFSGRRATTDIRACEEQGLLEHAPCYNAIFAYLAKPELTPILTTLVEEAAAPLKALETSFSVDATGFSTAVYRRWYDHRYGRAMKESLWVKAHASVGNRTNIIASIRVTGEETGDAPMLPELVQSTAERFDVREVAADKAYLTHNALNAIESVGATAYVPFKSNSKGEGPAAWRKLWHLFNYKRDEFLAHYHQRSNVEATFSALKRKFGGSVRSKLPIAQRNEVLAKALCYNLSALVHEMNQLGVEPEF